MQQQQKVKQYQQELDRIHGIVTGQKEGSVSLDRNIFELATFIGGVGDIIGREYKIHYDVMSRIDRIVQLPMRMDKLLSLFHQATEYDKRQKKQSKEDIPKGPKVLRGRR